MGSSKPHLTMGLNEKDGSNLTLNRYKVIQGKLKKNYMGRFYKNY